MSSNYKLYTIGYAAWHPDGFADILKSHGVNAVVDVRAWPSVSHFEEYKRENLRPFLNNNGFLYKFFGKHLGGRPENKNLYTKGKVDYKKLSESEEYLAALANIKNGLEKEYVICLMCAQKDPINCHRSILITHSFQRIYPEVEILHILQEGVETQKELDLRLVRLFEREKYSNSLFEEEGTDRLALAYAWQADKLAWRPDR